MAKVVARLTLRPHKGYADPPRASNSTGSGRPFIIAAATPVRPPAHSARKPADIIY